MEGADTGLSVMLLDAAVSGDWGRALTLDESDRRRGSTVDIRDGLEGLVGERKVPKRAEIVDGDGRRPLVGGGTVREAT